jgi:hypothetical protein
LLFLSHKADGFLFSHIIQVQHQRLLLLPNHKQFVHINIVQSRVHTNIIQSLLPTCVFFCGNHSISTVSTTTKISHKLE